MIKGYKFRLYPTETQEQTLLQWMEMQRRLWNFSVLDRTSAWEERKEGLYWISKKHPHRSQCRQLTISRAIYPELAAVPSSAQQALLKRVDIAFQNFFRRVKKGEVPGYPKYKKPGNLPSLVWEGAGNRKWIRNGKLSIPKLGEVKIVLHRPLPDGYTMKTVTVSQTAGKWYVSLGHENHILEPEKIEPAKMVGIDMGLNCYAALSNGIQYKHPNFWNEMRRKRTKLQRSLARKRKGSNNWRKVKRKIALLEHDVANARRYFQQSLARIIVDEYDLIAVEDLDIKGMQEQEEKGRDKRLNKGLHRNIADASWGSFVWMLDYKAREEGKVFVKVPARGTTQMCSRCGATVPKTLKDRKHICPYCGLELDRDVNAARNILARGLEQLGLCQPDVKPAEVTALADQ